MRVSLCWCLAGNGLPWRPSQLGKLAHRHLLISNEHGKHSRHWQNVSIFAGNRKCWPGVGAEDVITIYPVYLSRCFSGASTLNRPLLLLFKYFPGVREWVRGRHHGKRGRPGGGAGKGRAGNSEKMNELLIWETRPRHCLSLTQSPTQTYRIEMSV